MKKYKFSEAKELGKRMEKKFPEAKLYLVDGHKGSSEYTIRFTVPKANRYYTKGTEWYDSEHKIASEKKKRWKCNKFGNWQFPNDKVKAKALSDKLFKEW
jgi:hypothetical protein